MSHLGLTAGQWRKVTRGHRPRGAAQVADCLLIKRHQHGAVGVARTAQASRPAGRPENGAAGWPSGLPRCGCCSPTVSTLSRHHRLLFS